MFPKLSVAMEGFLLCMQLTLYSSFSKEWARWQRYSQGRPEQAQHNEIQ